MCKHPIDGIGKYGKQLFMYTFETQKMLNKHILYEKQARLLPRIISSFVDKTKKQT